MALFQLAPGSGKGQTFYDNLFKDRIYRDRGLGVLIKRKWYRAWCSRMHVLMVGAIETNGLRAFIGLNPFGTS